jgi:DNA-directed RNA polymerase subunit RPC12/RpoP
MRDKYIGPEEEIEIRCPNCGAKHKGKLIIEEEEAED